MAYLSKGVIIKLDTLSNVASGCVSSPTVAMLRLRGHTSQRVYPFCNLLAIPTQAGVRGYIPLTVHIFVSEGLRFYRGGEHFFRQIEFRPLKPSRTTSMRT